MPKILKKKQTSIITPTSSKIKTQTGKTSKSTTTPTTSKKAIAGPDDQATIIEQQQQITDKLLQQLNILEGKLSEIERKIFVTQKVNSHWENVIDR